MSDTPEVEQGGDSCCPGLSPTARNIGCAICLILGICISFFHFIGIFSPDKGFAIWITIGSVLIFCSSLFLSSLKSQWQKLMQPARATTTIIWLVSLALTVLFIILPSDFCRVASIICAVIQFCASFWYTLSLFPGAQKCCTNCICSCGKGCRDCFNGPSA